MLFPITAVLINDLRNKVKLQPLRLLWKRSLLVHPFQASFTKWRAVLKGSRATGTTLSPREVLAWSVLMRSTMLVKQSKLERSDGALLLESGKVKKSIQCQLMSCEE